MIGRLRLAVAMWWLWRRCDWVYRWAHHPLCGRFRHDVWRAGPMHLCRSCTLLYGSACATLMLAWGLALDDRVTWPALWILMVLVLPLSHPLLYRRWPRWMKDLLRGGAGIVFGLAFALLLHGSIVAAMTHLTVLVLIGAWYQRVRRPAIAAACEGCPELATRKTCSGFRLQTQRIMDFEPAATELVIRSGGRGGRGGWGGWGGHIHLPTRLTRP